MSTRNILHSEKQDTIAVDPLDDWNGEEDIEEYLTKWFCPDNDEYSQEKIDKWLDSEDCALKQHLITSEGLLRLGGGLREYKTKTHHVKLVRTGSKCKGNLNLPGNAAGGIFQMTPLYEEDSEEDFEEKKNFQIFVKKVNVQNSKQSSLNKAENDVSKKIVTKKNLDDYNTWLTILKTQFKGPITQENYSDFIKHIDSFTK